MNLAKFIRTCDSPLSPEEFGRLDALALAWATYFDFSGVNFPIAAKTLALFPFAEELEKRNRTFIPDKTADFMDAFLHSPRYQDVVFLEKREVRDEEAKIQFCALAFDVYGRIVVAFQGTDTTSLGWKEDFMMTYRDGIGSYPCALEFVQDVLSSYGGPITLAGHSKGGNVAAYVLASIPDDRYIEKVYSFEGPGFYRDDVFASHPCRIAKLQQYIPQCAIVGALLSTIGSAYVVKSHDFTIFQHNAIEWVIKNGDFVYAKRRTATSHGVAMAINGWVASLTDEEKERFTTLFFETFERIGISDFRDFFDNIFIKFPALSKAYGKLDPTEKRFFRKVMKILFLQSIMTILPRPLRGAMNVRIRLKRLY